MLRLAILTLSFVLMSACGAAQTSMTVRQPDALETIRELAERRYGGEAPGAAVLVMQGDEVLISEGSGYANLEWRQPASAQTSFRVGSITKIFTAAAILQLVEDGMLELDDPVSTWLPDLPAVLGQPTLRQLLSHTSGLGDHFSLPEIPAIMRNPITPEGITDLMADQPLQFEPGTQWAYSNFGYVLLGRVITAVDADHRAYADYIEEEIFLPLGMENSHYDRQSTIIPGRAAGYDFGENGPVNTITFDTSLADAAGALMTSADDMAIFTRALRGGSLLSPDMRDLAWTSTRLSDGSDTGYGLGFNVSDFMGETVIWHSGSINGFQATWIHQPATGRTVAVMSNGYYRPNTTDTARRILAILDGQPAPEFTETNFTDANWQGVQGRYELSDGRILQFHVQDGIRFNLNGGIWRELSYSGGNIFYSPDTLRHFILDPQRPEAVVYVSTTLERLTGTRTGDEIDGALVAVALDTGEARAISGQWDIGSGDLLTIRFDDEQVFLQLPYQPPQRIFRSGVRTYFSRSAPISVEFAEDGQTANMNLYGNTMTLTRE